MRWVPGDGARVSRQSQREDQDREASGRVRDVKAPVREREK